MTRIPRRVFRLPWRTGGQSERDLEEEFGFHYEMRIAELVALGTPPHDARRVAASEFGDLDDARDYIHFTDNAIDAAERRKDTMHTLTRSTHHAFRRLRRAPLFAVTSILTLAIGIGACSLMMSLVSTILLKPLPYRSPDRLEMVWSYFPGANLGFPEQPTHGRFFAIIRNNTQAFETVSAFRGASFNLGGAGSPERFDGVEATGEFFSTIGISPELGRFFERANEQPGNDRVVVLSDGLWRRRFGGSADVVGHVITLNAEPHTIIGVAPRGFAFPRGAEMPGDFQFAAEPSLWVPLLPPTRGPSDLAVVGRLRAGITHAGSRADMERIIGVVERLVPAAKGTLHTLIVPLRDQVVGHIVPMLISLLAAVVLVLAVACVNTAQLLLGQLHARRRDLAVRAALGASARRLAVEVFAEVMLLVVGAGTAGIVLGAVGLNLVRRFGSVGLPRLSELTFDGRSALAALGVVVLAAIMAGLIPMALSGRVPLVETLRAGGRGATKGFSIRARHLLIIGELALSVVLIASAGLLVRSLSRQLRSAMGFSAAHGMTFELSLPSSRYPETQQRTSMEHPASVGFLSTALENIRAIPGVDAAAIGKPLPLSGAQEATVFTPETPMPPLAPGVTAPIAEFTVASSQMFQGLGTPIIAGRDFATSDRLETEPVVIVNQSMAEWLWPDAAAVGKRIRVGPPGMAGTPNTPPWMTVIGVVSNMKRYSLTETPRPEMIVPYTQNPYPTFRPMQFVVRSKLPSGALLPAIRKAIADVDPSIPVAQVRTIDDLVTASSANARFVTQFMTGFGVVSLLLAAIGVYGVIGYGVQQRRQEFGVRRALGAQPSEIVRLVLRQSLRGTASGIGIGLVLALAAGFGLRHLLFDLSPFDPATFFAAVGLIVGTSVAASFVPALSAARVEPRSALEE